MKKSIIFCALLTSSSIACAGNWYIGFGAGASKALDADNNLSADQNALALIGVSSGITADENAADLSVFAGYQFIPQIAAEIGYEYLGKYKLNGAFSASIGSMAGFEEDKVSAVTLSAVLSAPITPTFSLFGRLGIADTTIDQSAALPASPAIQLPIPEQALSSGSAAA
jgi:OOP family OmpA-OmpF porin